MNDPQLSVIIPVYNEQETLPALCARLNPALDALGVSYEVLFVNDGSRDRSAALLKDQFLARPDVTRVILFTANHGQHLAIAPELFQQPSDGLCDGAPHAGVHLIEDQCRSRAQLAGGDCDGESNA